MGVTTVHGKSERNQDASEDGAGQVEIVPDAVGPAPAHRWEKMKGFGDVRQNDHAEARDARRDQAFAFRS